MRTKLLYTFSAAIGAIFLLHSTGNATTFTAVAGGGNWNSGATWGNAGNDVAGSGFPGASDTAVIGAGIPVTNIDTEACATLNINSTGICYNNATLTAATAIASPTSGGSMIQLPGSTLNLNGTTTVTTLNATNSGNTVNYGGAAQTVKAVAYQNLGLAGSGSKTMTSVINIAGNLTTSGTCTATLAGNTLIGGNFTGGGASVITLSSGVTNNGNFTVNGATVNTANNSLDLRVYGTTTITSGTLKFGGQSSAPLLSDVLINGGAFDCNGGVPIFTGNFSFLSGTNPDSSSASSQTWTFSGVGKTITGTFTLTAIMKITGSVTNNGAITIARYGSGTDLTGTGTWIQGANSYLGINASGNGIDVTTLDCTDNFPNTVSYNVSAGSGTTPKAAAYYNLVLNASSGWALSGLTVANNLTVNSNSTVSSWPANNTLGGTLTLASTSASTTTLPTTFTLGGLVQSSGVLAIPASGTLTVTGTGANAWARSGGAFTANSGSTVKFTGVAPGIGGTVLTTFRNFLIDSTATGATANGSGFVASNLTLNASAQLDVTALAGGQLVFGNATVLTNSGTIVGSVVTGSASKLYCGTDGGYGTSTVALTPTTGDLSLTAGTTVNMDVDSTASAANDLLSVGGTLTLNSTVFNLRAPSAGAAIDTANDYTLATANSVSGTPALHWVTGFVPANSTNYSLTVSSGAIKLHYTSPTPVGSPMLTTMTSGNTLTLSWDSATYSGYSVQVETNSAGLGAGWTDAGSGSATSPFMITIDPANPAVFYRLTHP